MSRLNPLQLFALTIAVVLSVNLVALGQPAVAANDDGAFEKTKTVTREFRNGGADEVVDTRNFKLNVDHTQNLRGRERVKISWSGARPSAGRASNPFGENGMNQEYPVVIMQCRGVDDSTLPADKQLRPETCWTSTRQQRSQSTSDVFAVWRHDLYASAADKQQKSGLDPIPTACDDTPTFSTHLTPFLAANGTTHAACNSATMPPEAAVGAAFPPAEIAAFTDTDGHGDVNFEVRSSTENESVGCNDKVACSIVVIPIMGLSCVDDDATCREDGQFSPGSSNFAGDGVDAAVSPTYWWSASNWRNRVSVPVTFGLPPDACDVLDNRAPTAFYGSELMAQASLQWSPAYCLRADRFKFQHNKLGDEPAFALVEKGDASAAFVSGTREADEGSPVGYAPTALTGFAVAYVIDKPDNAGEKTNLNLNARLLAKLLTQSYAGSARGLQHPGMANNPLSMNQDPEFKALNPGLDSTAREAAATVLSLSDSSDVIKSLTSYLAEDPEAKAFISGAPDPWGMAVNPSYKDINLPVAEFPLLDEFIPTSALECLIQNPAAYFGQIAAPVNSLRKIAESVLDGWPNVQTKCDRATSSDPYKVGRVDRQGIGARFMLGIVSLGDAARFGLNTAALQTASTASATSPVTDDAGRTFVTPNNDSITAAAGLAKSQGPGSAFSLDMETLRKTPTAYPGTMIVYTTAKLSGLAKADATKVSQFIKVATTEGQVPGSGNGRLPDGYVPIVKSGATKSLYDAAQKVAALIAAQKGLPEAGPSGDSLGFGPGQIPPVAAPDAAGSGSDPGAVTTDTLATSAKSSGAAGVLLPLLIVLALLAGLAGPATRLIVRFRSQP